MRDHMRTVAGPAALVVLLLLGYVGLRSQPAIDAMLEAPEGHFYVVSLVALLATVLAACVGIAGMRLRNTNVTFLALAYITLAGIFLVHGLSTPGMMMHPTALPKIAAQFSVLGAVILIWVSSFDTDHPLMIALGRWQRRLLPVWTVLVVLFGAVSMVWPHVIHFLPINVNPYKWIATAVTAAFSIAAIRRYRDSYRLTGFPLHILVIYSAALMIVAQIIMVTGETWRLSWWSYHFVLLASTLVMVIGVARQYVARGSMGQAYKLLLRPEPRAWIASSIPPSVRKLIAETEHRDAYTAGHNYRVALYALRLAEQLGLPSESLRALAQGGIVHDVGKLRVPDEILNKPGMLVPEERAVIELHPVDGYNLGKRIGFMAEELSVIRSHHEKWDGTGYPDRLAGEAIPLLARVTAVADVYDALTSSRSYRKAMSHDEAMAIIIKGSGSHFDPACVDAWVTIAEQDPGFFTAMRPKEMQEAAPAAAIVG